MKRKLKISITRVSRRTERSIPKLTTFCKKCGMEREICSRTYAMNLLQASDSEMERLIQAEIVHAISTVNNSLWICKTSLFGRDEIEGTSRLENAHSSNRQRRLDEKVKNRPS